MKYLPIFLMLVLNSNSYSQLQLADVFTDHMVLQRGAPLKVWGTASPGTPVEIKWNAKIYSAQVGSDGHWQLQGDTLTVQTTPQELVASQGRAKIRLKNILVGDVWLLLGQSNMEWPLASEQHYDKERSQPPHPLLRFYNPGYIGKNLYGQPYTREQNQALQQNELFQGSWQEHDSVSVKAMSAVGYYFGKSILEKQEIPLGLMNLSVGGAPIETFISPEALEAAGFKNKTAADWLDNPHLPDWIRERGRENVGHGNHNHAFRPGFVYQTGIAPLRDFPITGILWYQGESNAQESERVKEYPRLQQVMVQDFRQQWKNPQLPFYFVQLSSIDTLHYKSQLWPEFRHQQLLSMHDIPHSGMAVSLDHGAQHDVHPRNKKVIGQRLARWALRDVYQVPMEVSGPIPTRAWMEEGQVIISFSHARELTTFDGQPLRGFALDGREVSAQIDGNRVLIKTDRRPEEVTYAWKPYSNANLVNQEQLPAPGFKMPVKNP